MKPEPHRLQQDPPEGDPAVIDRELARQDLLEKNETARDVLSGQAELPGEPAPSDERATAELRDGAERDTSRPAAESEGDRSDSSRAMDEAAPQTGVRPGP